MATDMATSTATSTATSAPSSAPSSTPSSAPSSTATSTVTQVYVDGVFDLFHAGHVAFLAKARALGTRLIVGVITDEDAQWKRPPIVGHADRVTMLRSCRLVDEVIERPPLVLTGAFLRARRIDIVAHGDDDLQTAFFAAPIRLGIMRYVPYTAGISTTEIIRRVQARHKK